MEGIFAVYKPKGPTSNQVLEEIRKVVGKGVKVGHAGTLDPLARGVLVVGIGRQATKKLKDIVGQEKEYLATIKLGVTSTTDDEEGEKRVVNEKKTPSISEIKKTVEAFIGEIEQTPPVYSAVKIRGVEAYKRARRGERIKLEPRRVRIKQIEVLNYQYPNLRLKVLCGPGTYIRSLARDIGHKLATGGYLSDLERTRVGRFHKSQPLEEFLGNIQQKT